MSSRSTNVVVHWKHLYRWGVTSSGSACPTILSGVESGQQELLFVPCLFFGSSMYLEFPGLVIIGTGVGQGDVVARARTESVARRLKAVAEPTRLALLHSLATAPSTVGELAMLFRLAQPTVSMHVKVLRQSGLVRSERVGGRLRLSADPAAVEALLGELRLAVLQGAGAGQDQSADAAPAPAPPAATGCRPPWSRAPAPASPSPRSRGTAPAAPPRRSGASRRARLAPRHTCSPKPNARCTGLVGRRTSKRCGVVTEDPLVAVARRVEHAEVVALADRGPGHHDVLGGGAAERMHGRDPAQALLHGRRAPVPRRRPARRAGPGARAARGRSRTGACASSRSRPRAASGGT